MVKHSIIVLVLLLVHETTSCPVFCGCMFTQNEKGLQYVWHCGYQMLSNDKLDLILNDKNVSDVDQLFLNGNKITSFDSSELKLFSKLKHLYLDGNLINSLETNIFKDLPLLEHLSLVNNTIDAISTKSLSGANNLKSLDLSGNIIHSLTEHMFSTLTKLENLDISRNVINHLQPEGLHGLQKIKKLSLAGNKIDKIPSNFFRGLHDIETLDLSANRLTVLNKDILAPLTHLNYIDFSKNAIEKIGDRTFDQFKLYVLNLSNNNIRKISNSVFLDVEIKSLDLQNNPLLCDCMMKTTISNLSQTNLEAFVIKGDCSLLDGSIQLPLANLTSKLNCDFDCNKTSHCQNNGKCVVVENPEKNVFVHKCQCMNNFEGELCESKLKQEKPKRTKAIIVLVVVIPFVAILVGLAIFYRECKKRRQRSSDMAPLTDEDFAL